MKLWRLIAFPALTVLVLVLAIACKQTRSSSNRPQSFVMPLRQAVTYTQVPAMPSPPRLKPHPQPLPQISLGKRINEERVAMTKVNVAYLTLDGLKSEVQRRKAGKGNMFVALHFVGKRPKQQKEDDMVVLNPSGEKGRLEANDLSATSSNAPTKDGRRLFRG